ncbi:hypothetical protein SAY87_005527 [Trapa incisa]|uniref:DUF7054 domain-containing protein n=1 Tax=Trapa incisa TaxID=236973 RepID=A0AAN7K8Z9_9MYRT|nr:hypothetical protein SAY87_005527 [Trapa incisa]
MMFHKPKKNRCPRVNRILISIAFMGSAGPIRLVVDETDPVDAVILTALKSYRREGRLPILGSNFEDFLLYYGSDVTDTLCPHRIAALSPWDTIGSQGSRNFLLCKKPQVDQRTADAGRKSAAVSHGKGSRTWKKWIKKSFSRRISSH